MEELKEFLQKYINSNLRHIIISSARMQDGATKIKVRPVLLRQKLLYQATETRQTQEFHHNYEKGELISYIISCMSDKFRQLQLEGEEVQGTVLVSKKGKINIKCSEQKKKNPVPMRPLSHNRKKNYILEEGKAVPFLVELGVMTKEGQVVASRYDKFRQINRFLEFVEDILPRLDKSHEITILDFGCGKSYLTFAMYYYFNQLQNMDVRIIGLDLKADVIDKCNDLARQFGCAKLHFYQGDIASYTGVSCVDMVVTLHACDTATDYALAKAVSWGASVILSVPCCQHEINGQIQNDILRHLLSYGILKERFSALLTDGLRAELLKSRGYDVQILEFIEMEHTPKNLMIRAVKDERKKGTGKDTAYASCVEFFQVKPTLEQLFTGQEETNEKNIN